MAGERRPFGIMFHHFHDCTHPKGQGSMSSGDLERMIDFVSEDYTLLNADEWIDLSGNGGLMDGDFCLVFDDGLLCQYDVAYPVLKKRGIKAFWMHSHTHPLSMAKIDPFDQRIEYTTCYNILYGETGIPPVSMSHPMGSYDQDTIRILRNLGVRVGFRADNLKAQENEFEYPRIDHAIILKEMMK